MNQKQNAQPRATAGVLRPATQDSNRHLKYNLTHDQRQYDRDTATGQTDDPGMAVVVASASVEPFGLGNISTTSVIHESAYRTVAYTVDNPIQKAAIELYDQGFNIGPTKWGSKQPFRWRVLVGTRIDPAYILPLFANGVGIFVLTGRLSMNLTILDCDTAKEAEQHAREFEHRGLKPWRVNTARGAHFWWLSADGEIANVEGEGYQIWGNMHYCLCPPSIHPTGMIYEWAERDGALPPVISIAALDWLPLKPNTVKRREFDPNLVDADPLACLSKRSREFIKRGASEGTRNNRLFAAACDMAGNNFSIDDTIDMLSPAARIAGLSHHEINDAIRSAYSKERTPAKQHSPTVKPLPTWARAQQWAFAHDWVPLCTSWTDPKTCKSHSAQVTAQTARDVFLACCERSRRDSADVFRATRREVAELANVSIMTAHRALVCLNAAGLLIERGHSANEASLYAFGNEVFHHKYSTPHWSDISVSKSNTRSDARADVFRHGALGKTAERIWLSILPPNSPATKAEIARRAKCSRSTVTRLLSYDGLLKWGLVSQLSRGRWIANPADDRYLVDVAVKLGTAGKAEHRRVRHAQERAMYATTMILQAKRRWERLHLGLDQSPASEVEET